MGIIYFGFAKGKALLYRAFPFFTLKSFLSALLFLPVICVIIKYDVIDLR